MKSQQLWMASQRNNFFLWFLLVALWLYPRSTQAGVSADLQIFGQFSSPAGVAVDPTSNALFVADQNHHRVVRFDNRHNLSSNSSFTMSFGQNSLTSVTPGSGVNGLTNPTGIVVDEQGTLWVVDNGNNRVVWYLSASSISSMPHLADGYLGQSSWAGVAATNPPNASTMAIPVGIDVMGSTLWVADSHNYRILRFDGVTLPGFQSGALAAAEIGQASFSQQNISGAGPCRLGQPVNVKFTTAGLITAELTNCRVLFFPASNISQLGVTDGCATGVYGQPDLTTVSDCSAYVTSTSLGAIYGVEVASDGTLFVADYYHRRVIIYPADVPPSPFGVAAIDVLGQPNLESSGSGTQLDQLGGAYFMEWDDPYKCLWVCDYPNNRVLRYSNILSPVVQNTTGNGPSLSFPTRAPNAVLSPEGGQGSQLAVSPGSIEEVAANGSVAQTPFPQLGYAISSSIDSQQNQRIVFNTALPGARMLSTEYALFAASAMLNSAGITFAVQPGTLKFSFNLSGWNATDQTRSVRVVLALDIQPAVLSIAQQVSENTTTFILLSSTLNTTIRLLHFGVADNSTIAPIAFSLNSSSPRGAGTSASFLLVLDLPPFNHSFSYDPDFSVALGGQAGDGSIGGDGSGTNLWPLFSLFVLVVPVVFLVVVVIVLIARRIMWKRKRHDLDKKEAVNL